MANKNSHPLVSYQPFRLLFQLASVGTIVVRLPFWAAIALIRPLRPHPKWTAKQTFTVHLMHAIIGMSSRISITLPLSIEGGKEGDRFQVIKPRSPDRYIGPLESNDVKPATVGGTWYPDVPAADIASKLVVLYLHGGAFVLGDGRPGETGFATKSWLEHGGADAVFALQYRLAGYSNRDPFPAALQDTLTSYLFLLEDLQIPARQIVVSGDSAGGNLAIALLRYLHEFGAELGIPVPRCAALVSPWVTPLTYDALPRTPNWRTDWVPTAFLKWGANAYAGRFAANPKSEYHPYITPLGNPFPAPVPIFVNAGAAEVFAPEIARWAEEMGEQEEEEEGGNVVELHYEEAACHDTLMLGNAFGFEESAWGVAAKMGEFVRRY